MLYGNCKFVYSLFCGSLKKRIIYKLVPCGHSYSNHWNTINLPNQNCSSITIIPPTVVFYIDIDPFVFLMPVHVSSILTVC